MPYCTVYGIRRVTTEYARFLFKKEKSGSVLEPDHFSAVMLIPLIGHAKGALFLRLSRGHDVLFLIFCGENHTVVWVVCILCFVFFHTDLLNQYEQTKKTLCLKSSERANGKTYFFLIPPLSDLPFVREKTCPVFCIATSKARFLLFRR